MNPIYNEKALLLGDSLVIADLHLGIEYEMAKEGIKIPSQAKEMKKKISRLLERSGAKKLILLGDVKHNIPAISWREYADIPPLINGLSKLAEIVIIKGNHDGNLERLLPGTNIVRELAVEDSLLIHGHTKLKKELNYRYIIMGHNHPCIEFRDEFGRSVKESAWIKAKFNRKAKKFYNADKLPEIIIMPAFNDLIYGAPFNTEKKLLGPLFRKGLVDIENAEAYLLDGTMFRIGDITR